MDSYQLLVDLMEEYSKRGVVEWNKLRENKKKEIGIQLGWPIANHESHVKTVIKQPFDAEKKETFKFIPLLCDTSGLGFVFFLPMRKNADGSRFAFDLFLVVSGPNCLGFRWEPADGPDADGVASRHCYGHVQFCRRMVNGLATTNGVPCWMPDSWPAIPLTTSEPLLMFLSMITSIRGYGDHLVSDIKKMFPELTKRSKYEEVWRNHLEIVS